LLNGGKNESNSSGATLEKVETTSIVYFAVHRWHGHVFKEKNLENNKIVVKLKEFAYFKSLI
jgi:hypothetical protein